MDDTIADYFRIKYPANWVVNEQYDFNCKLSKPTLTHSKITPIS